MCITFNRINFEIQLGKFVYLKDDNLCIGNFFIAWITSHSPILYYKYWKSFNKLFICTLCKSLSFSISRNSVYGIVDILKQLWSFLSLSLRKVVLRLTILTIRVFANGPGDLSSIPGRDIPRTQKWYLMPPCLTLSIRYGSRVVEQCRERSSALLFTMV